MNWCEEMAASSDVQLLDRIRRQRYISNIRIDKDKDSGWRWPGDSDNNEIGFAKGLHVLIYKGVKRIYLI